MCNVSNPLSLSGVPYFEESASNIHPATSSPRKRKREAGEYIPTSSQCFVLSANNIVNFKRCLGKIEKQGETIRERLATEMQRIQDVLSSDSEMDDVKGEDTDMADI